MSSHMVQIVLYRKLRMFLCRYHLLFDPPPDQESKDRLKQVSPHGCSYTTCRARLARVY